MAVVVIKSPTDLVGVDVGRMTQRELNIIHVFYSGNSVKSF